MIDGSAPSEAPVAASAAPEASGVVPQPKQTSAFITHLRSYPIVDATVSYTTSIPLVKKASATAKPYVEKVSGIVHPAVEKASPVFTKVDKFGDSTLSKVDKFVPVLKTPPNITGTMNKSVESVKNTTQLYTDAAKSKVNATFVVPTKTAVDKAKKRTHDLYDTKGRPFVRAKLDPLVAPLNARLVAIVDAYLPPATASTEGDAQTAEAKQPTTEVGRLYNISSDAVYRFMPLITDRVSSTRTRSQEAVAGILAVPKSARSHVIAIWTDKAAKTKNAQTVTGTIYVSFTTGKQLASDVVSVTEAYIQDRIHNVKVLTKSFVPKRLLSSKVVAEEEQPAPAAPEVINHVDE
ncbi:hypothetical protein V1511DRAFT_508753 [Dipodascopsis uninucleata]